MAAWLTGKALGFDLESTGTSVFDDQIVTACAAIVAADGTVEFAREWLIAPGIDISPGATEKNGLTTEYAREHGMDPATGVKEIANAIRYAVRSRIPVVAFNAPFDISMLHYECARYGLGGLAEFCDADIFPVIDPLCIDMYVDKYRAGSRKLTDCAALYGVPLDNAHNAVADAVAAVGVGRELARRAVLPDAELRALYADRKFPDAMVRAFRALGRLTLPELHAAQVEWKYKQQTDRRTYWMSQAEQLRHQIRVAETDEAAEQARADLVLKEAQIDSVRVEWPLIPLIAQEAMPV